VSEIINEMRMKNILHLEEADVKTLVKSQDIVRKQSIEPRKFWWQLFGGKLPEYGITKPPKSTYLKKIFAFPGFFQFYFSRRKRNTTLLTLVGRISWLLSYPTMLIPKLNQILGLGINEITDIALSFVPKKQYIKKKTFRKIVIIGGYGSKDIGDEAMPHADLIHFRKKYNRNELEIVMLSENPEYTESYHHERSIADISNVSFSADSGLLTKCYNILIALRIIVFFTGIYLYKRGIHIRLWPQAFNALREIDSSDLIFNVGGGNLNSLIPSELYKKGITYIAAKMIGKPIVVSGQTIGPFLSIPDRLFARYALNKVDMITFRDKDISKNRCLSVGITKPIMIDSADDAMTLPYLTENFAYDILAKDHGVSDEWMSFNTQLTVCMNLKGSLRIFQAKGTNFDLSKMVKKFSKFSEMLLNHFDIKLIFIPTDFCPGVDDRELHEEVINLIKNKSRTACLEAEYNDAELKGTINLCDVAIGSRYHFCVFACSLFKPFLGVASGIYQKTKLRGLSLLAKAPECYYEQDLETANTQDLFRRAKQIIERRDSIAEKFRETVPTLQHKSRIGVNYALKLIEKDY